MTEQSNPVGGKVPQGQARVSEMPPPPHYHRLESQKILKKNNHSLFAEDLAQIPAGSVIIGEI